MRFAACFKLYKIYAAGRTCWQMAVGLARTRAIHFSGSQAPPRSFLYLASANVGDQNELCFEGNKK